MLTAMAVAPATAPRHNHHYIRMRPEMESIYWPGEHSRVSSNLRPKPPEAVRAGRSAPRACRGAVAGGGNDGSGDVERRTIRRWLDGRVRAGGG